MPWESIGSVDTGYMPGNEDWIRFCLNMALRYVKLVCGDAPPGVELSVMDNEHELGNYLTLGLHSEYSLPQAYVRSCEDAFEVFESSISWSKLEKHFEAQLRKQSDEVDDGGDT